MDSSDSGKSAKYSLPMPVEVTSPMKLLLESPSPGAAPGTAVTQPMIPLKLPQPCQKNLEPQVCLLPVTTPFSNLNPGSATPVQGSCSVSSLMIPGPSPLSAPGKTPSSPLVTVSSHLPMQIPSSPSPQTTPAPGLIPPASPSSSLLVGSSGTFGQTSHRSRKEKLICRSGADSMEVQSGTPSPSPGSLEEPSGINSVPSKSDPNSSPSKSKKPNSPTKGTRPYNRRKTASESMDKKAKDSLSKRVLVSNAHRRAGLSPDSSQKRSYKRRNTIATSSVLENSVTDVDGDKLSPPKTTGLENSSVKPKTPEKPKVSVAKGGLSQKEIALLPMLSKYVAPQRGTKSPVTTQTQPAPCTASNIRSEKRLADLGMFGSPNVLPIFKPNQKPWNLLKRFLEGKDSEESSATDSTDKLSSERTSESSHSAIESSASENNLDLVDGSSSDSEYADSDSEASSSCGEDSDIFRTESNENNVDPNITPHGTEEVVFTNEARALIEQMLVPNADAETSITKINSSRTRTESESSLPGFNIAPSPVSFSRPSSTPISSNSNSESPFEVNTAGFQFPVPVGGQMGDQHSSRSPESYQFKPIQRETPSSPLLGSSGASNSKWPWCQSGTESSSSLSRYQPPSPSPSTVSGSSANGGSGRRYSRRRHSRMYPAFETSHCMYSKHFCCAPLEPGSTYCIKHVSEKYSPYYVRCAFMSAKTGRRCPNMQYSRDGKNKFCNMHASRLALLRQKLYRKPRPTQTLREHFGEMQRLQNKLKKPKRTEAAAYLEDYCDYKLQTQCMENEIEVVEPPEANLSIDEMSRFQVEHDSDGGCEVQDEYECLKNAGYYTTEEVVRILKSKLSKLKELYLKEFDFLKLYYLLKRQEYLQAEDKIKESGVRVSRNPKTLFKWKDLVTDDFIRKEMKTYEKTKALLNYHKLRGQSAVLHHLAKKRYEVVKEKEVREKQFSIDQEEDTDTEDEANPILKDFLNRSTCSKEETAGSDSKSLNCRFDDGIIKCDNVALPSSDYCYRHVLQDENQVLFQPCNYPMDNKEFCQNPLLKKIDRGGCDFHRSFRLKRFCKSKEEKKARNRLFRSMPSATFKEHMSMLEDLVTSKFNSVEEFDAEVNYLEAKGLDCSDSSNSDYENDYDIQVDDDEDEEEESRKDPTAHKRKRSNSYRKQEENSKKPKGDLDVLPISESCANLINGKQSDVAAENYMENSVISAILNGESKLEKIENSSSTSVTATDDIANKQELDLSVRHLITESSVYRQVAATSESKTGDQNDSVLKLEPLEEGQNVNRNTFFETLSENSIEQSKVTDENIMLLENATISAVGNKEQFTPPIEPRNLVHSLRNELTVEETKVHEEQTKGYSGTFQRSVDAAVERKD